jgi:pimeloyl-ACP methyl ester carboxylesterase
MPDYPGFGKTRGNRNEKKMYEQALIVRQMAEVKYGSDSIIIYGKSLGTGIATYVSSISQNKALVLETPYYSIPSLFRHYAFIYPVSAMSNYKIPLYKYLQDVKDPVMIFHGTGDDVIPYSNALKLKPFLKEKDVFITIENGGHNNLNDSPLFNNTLDSLLKQ